jgi:predicted glycosyltransferase involved in capsule biosynthesis
LFLSANLRKSLEGAGHGDVPHRKILSCINQSDVRNLVSYLNKEDKKWFSEVNEMKIEIIIDNSAVCITTGPEPLREQVFHRV